MPPPRPRKARDDSAATIVIRVDDVTYRIRPDEVTAVDASALRRATGLSFRALLEAAQTDPDIDVIAALVWMARRQDGEPALAFDAVAATITYDSTFDADSDDGSEAAPVDLPTGGD